MAKRRNDVYTVLMIILLSAGTVFLVGATFIPAWREIGCKPMGLEPLFGKITFTLTCTTIGAVFVGTPIGLAVSRRRLRRLIAQLNEAGEKPQVIMTMMTHDGDKNIKRVAEEGLRLLAREGASLPPSAILVRAADAPLSSLPGILLRPAADHHADRSEQLLRASISNSPEVSG